MRLNFSKCCGLNISFFTSSSSLSQFSTILHFPSPVTLLPTLASTYCLANYCFFIGNSFFISAWSCWSCSNGFVKKVESC